MEKVTLQTTMLISALKRLISAPKRLISAPKRLISAPKGHTLLQWKLTPALCRLTPQIRLAAAMSPATLQK